MKRIINFYGVIGVIMIALCVGLSSCNDEEKGDDTEQNGNDGNGTNDGKDKNNPTGDGWEELTRCFGNSASYLAAVDFGNTTHVISLGSLLSGNTFTFLNDGSEFEGGSSYKVECPLLVFTNSTLLVAQHGSAIIGRSKNETQIRELSSPLFYAGSIISAVAYNNKFYIVGSGSGGSGLFESTNDGATWNLINANLDNCGIGTDGIYLYCTDFNGKDIKVSKDGGRTFTDWMTINETWGFYEGLFFKVEVDRNKITLLDTKTGQWKEPFTIDESLGRLSGSRDVIIKNNVIYVGLSKDIIDKGVYSTIYNIYKSTDGGKTFTLFHEGQFVGIGEKYIYVVAYPNGSRCGTIYRHPF